MTCYHPIAGRRDADGVVRVRKSDAAMGARAQVACGQCIGCRRERQRDFAVRCVHERKFHRAASFITLTHADETLPPNGSVDVARWQSFARGLRKEVGPFRFLSCGEYGSRSGRPHYHAVVFGHDFSADRRKWKESRGGHAYYTSATLERIWGDGFAVIGDLTFETAAYVAGYTLDKLTGERAWVYKRLGVKPPFQTMSRRKGLGYEWYQKYGESDCHRHDQVIVNGRAQRPPRYYDRLLAERDPERMRLISASRQEEAPEYTQGRLNEKEGIVTRRIEHFMRREVFNHG